MEMDSFVALIKRDASVEECSTVLQSFVKGNMTQFTFCDRGYPLSSKVDFIKTMMNILKQHNDDDASKFNQSLFLQNILLALRILSRERKGLDEIQSQEGIATLLQVAGFMEKSEERQLADERNDMGKVEGEAIKCLLNSILNNDRVQSIFFNCGGVRGLLADLKRTVASKKIQAEGQEYEKFYYQLQVLFLMTAAHSKAAESVVEIWEVDGLSILLDLIELYTTDYMEEEKTIPANHSKIIAEIFKILFTTTAKLSRFSIDDVDTSEEETKVFEKIVQYSRKLSLKYAQEDGGYKGDAMCQLLNVLINLPVGCDHIVFKDRSDFEFIYVIVDYIDVWCVEPDWKLISGHIAAPLSILRSLSRINPELRKDLYQKILNCPRDFKLRPEQEDNYRGHLVKLMTSHLEYVKDLIADLLFVLCKEDMSRLIKHTGYGNAAGLMANKGLFGKDMDKSDFPEFSSEDEEEAEEAEVDPRVNPVTGSFYSNKPDPISQLTEEEKEAEAEKLGLLFEKLNATGVIKVMQMNEDGQQTEFKGASS